MLVSQTWLFQVNINAFLRSFLHPSLCLVNTLMSSKFHLWGDGLVDMSEHHCSAWSQVFCGLVLECFSG